MVPMCPECDRPGVPLLFGLPVQEARDAAAAGDLALGGCIADEERPNWQCSGRHRWRDANEEAWDRRLLAVLVRHGYREFGDRE
jgi:hypothetical protein